MSRLIFEARRRLPAPGARKGSIAIEPQIMPRSSPGPIGGTPRSANNRPDAMRSVIRPMTGKGSRVTVG